MAVTRISTRMVGSPRAGTPICVQIGARRSMRVRNCSTMTRLWTSKESSDPMTWYELT